MAAWPAALERLEKPCHRAGPVGELISRSLFETKTGEAEPSPAPGGSSGLDWLGFEPAARHL